MKRVKRRVLSVITVLAMVVVSISSGVPKQAQAMVSTKEISSNYLNCTMKYLNLGEQDMGGFDFNIKKEAIKEGATYSWYVKTDKGNLNSVRINKKNGCCNCTRSRYSLYQMQDNLYGWDLS